MVDPGYVQMMARYNAWQNQSLYAAAATLDDAARRRDRGAFFGSVHATLSHLLWGDTVWMSRFDAWDAPVVGLSASPGYVADWPDLAAARRDADARILDWAVALRPQDLDGTLDWFSGALGREVSKPLALCVMHFFNHQTHHRGQVHGMLTAAGVRPGDTDLFVMPATA
ncbi:MAG: DinB family protein [Pseudomonadota bacterium]